MIISRLRKRLLLNMSRRTRSSKTFFKHRHEAALFFFFYDYPEEHFDSVL